MTTSEWEQLVKAVTDAAGALQSTDLRGEETPDSTLSAIRTTGSSTRSDRPGPQTAPADSSSIEDLLAPALASAPADSAALEHATSSAAVKAQDDGGSVAGTVLKTIGMATGVGPIVTGLVKLFGGGGDEEAVYTPIPYALPDAVEIEAGVGADRSISALSYSQDGTAREARTTPAPTQSSAQIQINVQAMDSRSFLDHRDEIAQAVREAMLNSHSLNDVVSEL